MTIVEMLQAPLDKNAVKTRQQSGMTLSYVDGHHVISEANRIFGHFDWTREVVHAEKVQGEQKTSNGKEKWYVSYTCRVRVTVRIDDAWVHREGCGFGQGIDADIGKAHESAYKEAETDAMKRALMTFGNTFGLALYDKSQKDVAVIPQEWKLPSDPAKVKKACEKAGVPFETLCEVAESRGVVTAPKLSELLKELEAQVNESGS